MKGEMLSGFDVPWINYDGKLERSGIETKEVQANVGVNKLAGLDGDCMLNDFEIFPLSEI